MDVIYKVGIVIGIIAIYTLVTLGLGALINHNDLDAEGTSLGAWLIGEVLFLILALFTLEKFRLWMA